MTDSMSSAGAWAIRTQQAFMEEGIKNLQRFSMLPKVWQRVLQAKKGVTPSRVVYEEDRLKLLHYETDADVKYSPPLVVIFALVNRPYVLDLQEGRSVVANFVGRGFDTFLIDWGVPLNADRHLSMDDYVNGYIHNVVDHVRERTGSDKINLLAYCMGGTMGTIFTALHQEKVRNLILMAAGIDFATREGLLNLWTDERYFDVDSFLEVYGNCPSSFLQAAFLMMNPVQNTVQKFCAFAEGLHDEKFVENFLTMETWLNDNIPLPGEMFREFVIYLYQKNLLTKNQLPVGTHVVDLRRITCPVLNLMATNDDLVPCAQSRPLNDLISSEDKQIFEFPSGHIGLAVGSRAQRELWPKVCDWLAERSVETARG